MTDIEHLRAVGRAATEGRAKPGRRPREACAQGHPMTPDNTRPRSDGRGRVCLACKRESSRRQEAKAAAKRAGRYSLGDADMMTIDAERFWGQVDRDGECWLWTGRKVAGGYGTVHVPSRRTKTSAHRAAWVLAGNSVDALPGGDVDHLCNNPGCVNPAHLQLVPQRMNLERSANASSVNRRKTHCKRGHEFAPENTKVTASGHRVCRTCRRETQRARRSA